MRKLRWVMDGGGFWDLDISTPKTLDGLASPVPDNPLPLGLSRGTRLSRHKQIEFMQRFMHAHLTPTFAKPLGFCLQRVLTLPFSDNWNVFLLGQFNFQKFVSSIKSSEEIQVGLSSWLKTFQRHLKQKSLYALGFCSEFHLTPDDTVLFGLDAYDYTDKPRGKAVLHHKFPHHDLTMEAVYPGLFVDKIGNYWDVPLSLAVDLASVTTNDSSISYHLSGHYNSGSPELFENIQNQSAGVPPTLLPGLAFKSAFSYRKGIDIWRSEAPKLRLVQPYDIFLSSPHVSASGIIGAAATTALGDNSVRAQVDDRPGSGGLFLEASRIKSSFLADLFSFWQGAAATTALGDNSVRAQVDDRPGSGGLFLEASRIKSSFLADLFGSVSFTAQHGNFQRLFLDLTRFQARLNFPSGFRFLSGATSVAQDLLNSQKPNLEAVQAICPNVTLSLQQQIVGPVSFRVDSGFRVDLKNLDRLIEAQEPVFAVEYALQVLGSAKAVAWYCPKRQEFMTELRFFET